MSYDFTLRIWKPEKRNPYFTDTASIIISDITVMWKQNKYDFPVYMKKNQRIFGYTLEVNQNRIHKVAGSVSYPIIYPRGAYFDIHFKNFPRFPLIGQSNLKLGFSENEYVQDWVKHTKTEIINLKHQTR